MNINPNDRKYLSELLVSDPTPDDDESPHGRRYIQEEFRIQNSGFRRGCLVLKYDMTVLRTRQELRSQEPGVSNQNEGDRILSASIAPPCGPLLDGKRLAR